MSPRKRLFWLMATFLLGILAACGLASGPSLLSRPETSSPAPEGGVAAYYDGNPQSVTIRDAAIAFAIASGITQPSQIVSFLLRRGKDLSHHQGCGSPFCRLHPQHQRLREDC